LPPGRFRLRPDRFLQKKKWPLGVPFYDFFGEITLEDGDSLSEDYSFCKRWRSMPDSEIWAVVDEPIGHVGDMVVRCALPESASFRARPDPTPRRPRSKVGVTQLTLEG